MPAEFPYLTILETKYKPLEVIEEKLTADAAPHPWYNETLCNVNDSVVRLGVVQGNYHWHNHQREDEFFYVVEGRLLIDLIDPQDPATTRQSPHHRPRPAPGSRHSERRHASPTCAPAYRHADGRNRYHPADRKLILLTPQL